VPTRFSEHVVPDGHRKSVADVSMSYSCVPSTIASARRLV
jgi:hypothetical protein